MEEEWLLEAFYKVIQDKPDININEDQMEQLMSKVIENTLPEASSILLDSLKHNSMEMLEEHRLIRIEFEARLQRIWTKPMSLLETLIVISSESGELCYKNCQHNVVEENNIVFDVLAKIHARAVRISYEVLTLLRGGFADGAMSRWRTLYELVVLSYFIK